LSSRISLSFSSSDLCLFCPTSGTFSVCTISVAASFGVLAPFVELGVGAGAGESEDGALGRDAALAGLPEPALFIVGAVIGGLGIGVPFGRPKKAGLVTTGGLSDPAGLAGC
jgi:hypothetical protein